MANHNSFLSIASLLQKRVDVIADHSWRNRDPAGHLAELQRVSEAINEEHLRLSGELPPKLKHYLQQCSYQKALHFIEGAEQ